MRNAWLKLVLGVVAAAVSLAWISCSGGAVGCDASNCNGCCDAHNMCQGGASTDACGRLGNACVQCASADAGFTGVQCKAGACINVAVPDGGP
jgi:hypothetical protein